MSGSRADRSTAPNARPVVGDPTDEILAAASRLFGERGVGGTTMSQIASEAGLQQSSLYYYFRSKEEILAGDRRPGQRRAARARRAGSRQDGGSRRRSGCSASSRGDVAALCALPFDINEVHRFAARDRERFAATGASAARCSARWPAIVREASPTGRCATSTPGSRRSR